MKRVSVNIDQMKVFVTINKVGMMINVDASINNQLIKVYVIEDIFGILVTVIPSVNVINRVILVKIQTMKIVSAEKGWQINWQKNIKKLLKK